MVSADFYHDYHGEMDVAQDRQEVEVVLEADGTNVSEAMDEQLLVYPNPAATHLTVQTGEVFTNVRLTDMQGRVVYDAEVPGDRSHEVNVSNLRTGIYLMQVPPRMIR